MNERHSLTHGEGSEPGICTELWLLATAMQTTSSTSSSAATAAWGKNSETLSHTFITYTHSHMDMTHTLLNTGRMNKKKAKKKITLALVSSKEDGEI